jgi:hypothetical protein
MSDYIKNGWRSKSITEDRREKAEDSLGRNRSSDAIFRCALPWLCQALSRNSPYHFTRNNLRVILQLLAFEEQPSSIGSAVIRAPFPNPKQTNKPRGFWSES